MFETDVKLNLKVFGESHNEKIGAFLKGIKKGIPIDLTMVQSYVDRRKSTNSPHSTKRFEPDEVIITKGIADSLTTGEEIEIEIKNVDVRSNDYDNLKNILRPSHADYPAYAKWRGQMNMSGGGKFSGRLTAPIVAAGGIAKQILNRLKIETFAYIKSIGGINGLGYTDSKFNINLLKNINDDRFRLLDESCKEEMLKKIEEVSFQGDSVGGTIEAMAINLPAGIGDTMFDSIESKLSSLLFAIPAVKGVEFGLGFKFEKLYGSAANDCYYCDKDKKISTYTNNNGGILGGISNGMPIALRVAIKPTASISKPQKSVNIKTLENTILEIKGRHDACIVPRAVVVVESMLNIALLELLI